MKTRTMRGIAAALGTVGILAGTAAQASATGAHPAVAKYNDPAATPAAYANYLRHSHEEGSADALKQFQRLSPADQNKFVGYLHDPAVLKALLDKTSDQGAGISVSSRNTGSKVSLHGGDVIVGQEGTISGISAASHPLPKGNHEVTYTTYIKALGIKIIKLNLSVKFYSNGRDITKAIDAEASKKNLSGAINLSHDRPKKWLSDWSWCQRHGHCSRGHNAEASVIWEGSAVFRGAVFQVDKKQWMQANVYGKLTNYYLHNV
ncbi:hypothetical protein [Streptomyces olivochromogenes]|uniref:hypothetical protein n=1 Tax=Streptomyces olivochromogenes TaxID=1963 RepID=UPI001F3CF33E|nr:hypothetical protein [Streptomyces olivochromogenes]MCF3129036.1 hypothetical protein [Streptomyces olivochromogenes]